MSDGVQPGSETALCWPRGRGQLLRMDVPGLSPGPHTTVPVLASHWPGRGRGKGQAGTGLREGRGIGFARSPREGTSGYRIRRKGCYFLGSLVLASV